MHNGQFPSKVPVFPSKVAFVRSIVCSIIVLLLRMRISTWQLLHNNLFSDLLAS